MPGDDQSSPPDLRLVLAGAARLQEIVPGAVLVGGSAAAHHVGHRLSFDHDHVVSDLTERFDTILSNLEAIGDWSTARAQPGKIILGELGGIESGVRQLRRARPLEVEHAAIGSRTLTVPTIAETLRIKAWLILSRNQVRDYLDVAAISHRLGIDSAAAVLNDIDAYYHDLYAGDDRAATQLVRQLAEPRPRDHRTITLLGHYKQLDPRWHEWSSVTAMTSSVATRMVERGIEPRPEEGRHEEGPHD